MAVVTVEHHPDLTVERAMEVFRNHFAEKYEVRKMGFVGRVGRDFMVKKSEWTAVSVKLKQQENQTSLVYTAFLPSFLLSVAFGGLIAYLFLRPGYKAMEDEVKSFIEKVPEFN